MGKTKRDREGGESAAFKRSERVAHTPKSERVQHVGFAGAVAAAKAGGARNPAAAIAAGAQKASAAAKRRNPALTKVGGVGKKGHRGAGQAG